jgi:hypothetical protein
MTRIATPGVLRKFVSLGFRNAADSSNIGVSFVTRITFSASKATRLSDRKPPDLSTLIGDLRRRLPLCLLQHVVLLLLFFFLLHFVVVVVHVVVVVVVHVVVVVVVHFVVVVVVHFVVVVVHVVVVVVVHFVVVVVVVLLLLLLFFLFLVFFLFFFFFFFFFFSCLFFLFRSLFVAHRPNRSPFRRHAKRHEGFVAHAARAHDVRRYI